VNPVGKPFKGIVNIDSTIHKCVIDVSGEPFVDLANEAFARD
jgi:imidazoleglycerol phosphate dehydratase HisB